MNRYDTIRALIKLLTYRGLFVNSDEIGCRLDMITAWEALTITELADKLEDMMLLRSEL